MFDSLHCYIYAWWQLKETYLRPSRKPATCKKMFISILISLQFTVQYALLTTQDYLDYISAWCCVFVAAGDYVAEQLTCDGGHCLFQKYVLVDEDVGQTQLLPQLQSMMYSPEPMHGALPPTLFNPYIVGHQVISYSTACVMALCIAAFCYLMPLHRQYCKK